MDDYDICYECKGYGDDWSISADGEMISNCDGCPVNERISERIRDGE